MIAVVKVGGKQYKIQENETIRVEKCAFDVGQQIKLDKIVLISDDAGEQVKIGKPFLDGAAVMAKVRAHGKGKKIDVIKYKSKVRYRRKQGHRQPYTELLIEKISA